MIWILAFSSITTSSDDVDLASLTNKNSEDDIEFSHEHHDLWHSKYPKCGGKKQSPVDINSSNFTYNDYVKLARFPQFLKGSIVNTGEDIIYKGDFDPGEFSFKFFDTNYTFEFDQLSLRFHCSNNNQGTEHSVDGRKEAAELRFQFTNSMYSRNESSKNVDGLLIISVRATVKSTNLALMIIAHMSSIKDGVSKRGSSSRLESAAFPGYRFRNVLTYILNDKTIAYRGSLTEPPCHESVIWIIPKRTGFIKPATIENLRAIKLSNGHRLCSQIRPIQRTLDTSDFIV